MCREFLNFNWVVKRWCEMFVLKLSGIQNLFKTYMINIYMYYRYFNDKLCKHFYTNL